MKKVLFATTALVASAGIASAQGVEISGAAEMGYGSDQGGGAEGFFQSVDIFFDMTGETDNGLTFGASLDLDDAGGTVDEVDRFADFTVFIGGAFGNLTMGDTDGAMDWAITEAVGNPGSIGDNETGHAGYLGGNALDGAHNGQILRYDNSFGDFGFAVSVDVADQPGVDTGFGIGATYGLAFAGGTVDFGVAYQSTEVSPAAAARVPAYSIGGVAVPAFTNLDAIAVSAALALDSGFSAALAYTDINVQGAQDAEHYQVSLGYEFGPFAIGANYGDWSGASTADGYGLAASYDLGGGASLHLGYGDGGTQNDYSFGLAMSF
jgi:outer membrane protein OmpU